MAGDLSIHDLDAKDFQRREWRVERVGWVVIALLLVAAILGVFSNGPLSHTTSADPDGDVEVEYERFVRHMGKAELTVRIGPSAVQDETATVFISRDLIDSMRLEAISPQPESTTGGRIGTTFEFSADADSPPVISITYRPDEIGVAEGTVRIGDDHGGARVWQLTYP